MQASPQETRGVYRLPWIGPAGQRYFVAVDRFGKRVCSAAVPEGQHHQTAVDILWGELDERDPNPSLRLVS